MVPDDVTLANDTFIQGKIDGWSPRAVYKLGDGTKWRLTKPKVRAAKKTNPRAKLWVDKDERYYLEILGLGQKLPVAQVM